MYGIRILRALWYGIVGAAWAMAPAWAESFHAYSWSPVPADCVHITPLVWFRADSRPAEIAAESRQRPPGHRALFSWDMHRDILDHPEDKCRDAEGRLTQYQGIWPEHGIKTVRELFQRFFQEFKAAGGTLDWFILDYEGGYSNWHLGTDLSRWRAIQNDPRFAPLAAQLGFSDLALVAEFWKGEGKYLLWNALMAGRVAEALRQACFEPVREFFPEAKGSNYGDCLMTQENAVPDLNGHGQWSAGPIMGTHQAPSFYTWIGQLGDRRLAGDQPFGRTPFAGLLLSLNTFRALQRSSETPITPWIAWHRYMGDGPHAPPATCGNTPYYHELIRHLAVGGVTTYLFWNPHPWRADQDPESLSTARDERLLEHLLAELEERLSGEKRTPLTKEAIAWDARVIGTALQLGDRVVWRITVASGIKAVRFRLGEQLIERPIRPEEPGFWLTHSAQERLTQLEAIPAAAPTP